MSTAPLLEVKNLRVEFPTRRGTLVALDGVSFDIAPGEVLGVVGESGAGKSLTGAAIIGLLEPPGRIAGGEILLAGRRIDNLPHEQMRALRGRRIGAIFQDPLTSLNPLYTVGRQLVETIRTHLPLTEKQARERAIALLADTGMEGAEPASASMVNFGIRSALATPLEADGQVLGMLYLDVKHPTRRFDREDLRLATVIAHLAADSEDRLGEHRFHELKAAMEVLGVTDWRLLGQPHKYRDSGMVGTPANDRPDSFWRADLLAAASDLVAVIREVRPQVAVTYDDFGGYGHPDHIQAHRVTTAAVRAAAERWAVPKFYWTVLAVSAFRAGLEALGPQDVPADWIRPPGEVPFGFTDEQITAEIDAQEHLGAKVAAMSAHATQVVVGPTGRAFSLSNKMVLPVLGAEHYVLVAGRPGPVGERGWETDLLAGLELSGN